MCLLCCSLCLLGGVNLTPEGGVNLTPESGVNLTPERSAGR